METSLRVYSSEFYGLYLFASHLTLVRRMRSVGAGVGGAALFLPGTAQGSPHVRQTEAPVNLNMTGSVWIFNILCSTLPTKNACQLFSFCQINYKNVICCVADILGSCLQVRKKKK